MSVGKETLVLPSIHHPNEFVCSLPITMVQGTDQAPRQNLPVVAGYREAFTPCAERAVVSGVQVVYPVLCKLEFRLVRKDLDHSVVCFFERLKLARVIKRNRQLQKCKRITRAANDRLIELLDRSFPVALPTINTPCQQDRLHIIRRAAPRDR